MSVVLSAISSFLRISANKMDHAFQPVLGGQCKHKEDECEQCALESKNNINDIVSLEALDTGRKVRNFAYLVYHQTNWSAKEHLNTKNILRDEFSCDIIKTASPNGRPDSIVWTKKTEDTHIHQCMKNTKGTLFVIVRDTEGKSTYDHNSIYQWFRNIGHGRKVWILLFHPNYQPMLRYKVDEDDKCTMRFKKQPEHPKVPLIDAVVVQFTKQSIKEVMCFLVNRRYRVSLGQIKSKFEGVVVQSNSIHKRFTSTFFGF